MIYNILSEVTDPIEHAASTFALWNCMTRLSHIPDAFRLLRPDLQKRLDYLRERREDRIAEIHLRKRLAWFDLGGYVWVSVSGMDCDCTKYAHKYKVSSDFDEYCAWVDKSYEWADGPMSISILSEDAAATFEDYSRDLALEAYEDGHPHVIYA